MTNEPPCTRLGTWLWVAGALLVLAFAARTARRPNDGDLIVYWNTWRRVLAGEDMYHRRETVTPREPTAYIYPPPFALVFAPLGALPYPWARFTWCLIGGLACLRGFACALELVQRERGPPARAWLAVGLGGLLALRWVLDDLGHGQVNGLVAALALEGVWRAESGRERSGALCLGAAVAIKLTPALVVLGWMVAGRWRLGLACAGAACALLLLPGLALGPLANLELLWRFATDVTAWNYGLHVCVPANLALAGVVHHALVGYSAHAGAPPVPALLALDPALARGLSSGLGLLVTAGLLTWVARARPGPATRAAVLLGAVPLVSPIAWKHHLAGLLLPCALAGRLLAEAGLSRAARAALLLGAALTALSSRACVGRTASDALLAGGGVTLGVALLVLGLLLAPPAPATEPAPATDPA